MLRNLGSKQGIQAVRSLKAVLVPRVLPLKKRNQAAVK
jgi:hypothetical protein